MGRPESEPRPRMPRKKEIPQFSVIATICHGVEVVEMVAGERKYHVTWEKDAGPAHLFFDTAQEVLNNHERVLERFLGTEIPLSAGQLLAIPGETQKMAELSSRLSTLGARYLMPLSPQNSTALKNEIEESGRQLGQVTNEYKQAAKAALESALSVPRKEDQVDRVLEANLSILARNKECLLIVQGTLFRFRIVSHQRDEWESKIEENFKEIAEDLHKLEQGDLTIKAQEQIARHVSGSKYGVLVRLNEIEGPEYFKRIQKREVQNLACFGDFLRQGDERRAKKILREAILKLKRVVKEKQKRDETNVNS